MSPQIIRIIIAAVLLLHGIAHIRPAAALLVFASGQAPRRALPLRSWLSSLLPARAVALIGSALWLAAALGFIAAALSFWGVILPAAAWRPLAILSAIVSTIGIACFSFTWPGAPSRGESALDVIIALAVNLVVLVALLWLHWPKPAF